MMIGIDLGTTNSACAIWRDGAAVMVPNGLGDVLTPSAVSIDAKGTVTTGLAARDRQVTHPVDTATVFKRRMGTRATTRLGDRTLDAEALSALVLASLKADAEAFTGETVNEAVITVPAYFNDRQRKATRRAGEMAGLDVRRLINEPTAAALAFGLQDRADHEPFLVFDLGGGTFDVSIVEMYDGIVEVRASAGDNRLGGEDFNTVLVDLAQPLIDPDGWLRDQDALVTAELLRAAAERCRRGLTDASVAEFAVTVGGRRLATAVSADEFEAQAAGLLARLREPVLRSLRDSDIRVESLSEVVLVGGATRMPIVRRAITRMFGRFPATRVHPDHAVALGAAVQAGLLARDAALDEIRLTDVCPFTLGVEVSDRDVRGRVRAGLFSPIIDRNTPIPVSRAQYYSTITDDQRVVMLQVYQGEARDVAENVRLGALRIPLTPVPGQLADVECRFTYDPNGMLEVDARVMGQGETYNLVILDGDEQVDPAELARRRAALADLKHHPRDAAENVALSARAGRCYESFLGEQRELIHQYLTAFETALDRQDPRTIAEAARALGSLLDALEGERFL